MVIRSVCLCLAAVLIMGCSVRDLVRGENRGSARGILYSNSIEPYTQDFRNTPVGSKSVVINTHRLKEPISQLKISGEWDTGEIIRLAREEGITEVRHIDIKTTSILLGAYRRQSLIVYGD